MGYTWWPTNPTRQTEGTAYGPTARCYMSSKCADKKEKKIFLIYKEIQKESGAKSYMKKGFLIFEEIRKYLVKNEEAVSHI